MIKNERTKHNQEHQIQDVKGFSDTLKQAHRKRVKAWFAEKWDYLTSGDVLIDTAATCFAVALVLGFGWSVKRILEMMHIIGGQ